MIFRKNGFALSVKVNRLFSFLFQGRMAVAATGRRSSVRVQVSGFRFAVQGGDQPAVFAGPDTEGQTDSATGVHQRSDRSGPRREYHNDRAARGSGVRCRRGQPVARASAQDQVGAAQRAGVRNDTLRHVPGGHAALVRPALQCRATGLGRRAVFHQTGVELLGPGGGQATAGLRRSARDELERGLETPAVAAGRDELCAGEVVPVADIEFQLFQKRQ